MEINNCQDYTVADKWEYFTSIIVEEVRHNRNGDVISSIHLDPFAFNQEECSISEIIMSFYDEMRKDLKTNKTFSVLKKRLKVIGIEGCDFSGKTTMVNKLKTLGYDTMKQPSTLTRGIINKLAEVRNLSDVSTENKRLLELLIAYTFEIDRMVLLYQMFDSMNMKNKVVISDRTSLSNFLVNSEMFDLVYMNLDDKVSYIVGLKKFDTISLMYKKLLKLNLEVASYFNYTICWCSNFDKYSYTDVYQKVLEAQSKEREEACPDLDIMDTEEQYIYRVIKQQNVVDVLLNNSKYIKTFDIRKMYSSYFMDEDECLMKVISKIKEFL